MHSNLLTTRPVLASIAPFHSSQMTHNYHQFYTPAECTCVTEAWAASGPTSPCRQYLCQINPSLGPCVDPKMSWKDTEDHYSILGDLGTRCQVPYMSTGAFQNMKSPNPKSWDKFTVAANMQLFPEVRLNKERRKVGRRAGRMAVQCHDYN